MIRINRISRAGVNVNRQLVKARNMRISTKAIDIKKTSLHSEQFMNFDDDVAKAEYDQNLYTSINCVTLKQTKEDSRLLQDQSIDLDAQIQEYVQFIESLNKKQVDKNEPHMVEKN